MGELDLDEDDKEDLLLNPLSKIILFDDDKEFYQLSRVFLQIPFDREDGRIVGKQYDAIKDYLMWSKFDLKRWVPIFVSMGNVWANNIKR